MTSQVLGAGPVTVGAPPAVTRPGRPVPAQRHPVPDRTGAGEMSVVRRTGPRTDVLLVDPDQTTREALRRVLSNNGVGAITGVGSLAELSEQLGRGLSGSLALVSLAMGAHATAVVTALRGAGWERVVALAPTADIGPVIDAVGAGISGVVIGRRANPAARNIPSTIHELSSREIEVIRLVADGRSNKWIGEQLALSSLTVKSHLARIGRKLGTGDRAHMVALAMRAGVIC